MNLVNKEYQKRARTVLSDWQERGVYPQDFKAPDSAALAGMIDHTLLKPDASISAVNTLCREAQTHGFASVCVNPVHVERCVATLGDSVPVCTVVGFPLGANHTRVKVAEAQLAQEQGAVEIDMVINIGLLKTANYQEVFEDIKAVRHGCADALLKVILETCLLSQEEIIIACLLCREAGADFVKTSTGFSSAGATPEDVSLMRFVVGDDLGVKASGGIKTKQDALDMIRAGANRLGASAGVSIVAA